MNKSIIDTKKAPGAIGPYSQGVAARGSFVFTAGQIGIDPSTGDVVADDIMAQTRQVLENLTAILEAGGSSLNDVVKTTVFLRDMNDFSAMNEVYGQFFKGAPPARSTVQVGRLPKDVRVEIEAIGIVQTS